MKLITAGKADCRNWYWQNMKSSGKQKNKHRNVGPEGTDG